MQRKIMKTPNTFTLHTKIDIQWNVKNEEEAENLKADLVQSIKEQTMNNNCVLGAQLMFRIQSKIESLVRVKAQRPGVQNWNLKIKTQNFLNKIKLDL